MKRNRFLYFSLFTIVIILGLASRRYPRLLPQFLAEYSGDALWALMVFLGIGFIVPQWNSLKVAVYALLFSYAIEISQLYHAPWIDMIRHTTMGGLILGYTFMWSDLVCYTVGVAFGLIIEMIAEK